MAVLKAQICCGCPPFGEDRSLGTERLSWTQSTCQALHALAKLLHAHGALQAHAAKSKKDMSAREAYPEPRLESVVVVAPNKQLLGRTFARNAKPVQEYLERMDDAEALCLKESLDAGKYVHACCCFEPCIGHAA